MRSEKLELFLYFIFMLSLWMYVLFAAGEG